MTDGKTMQLRGTWLERFLREQVCSRLALIERGQVTLIDGGMRRMFGRKTTSHDLSVTIRVLDAHFYVAVALEGSVGAGASYARGEWTCDDLAGLVRIFSANRAALDGMERGLAKLSSPILKWFHARRANTKEGSRRNIREHYDLGNEFFATFLDPTWMYSSAIFEREDMTLEEASVAKLDRICRKLGLEPGHRVLEIGTGWGGFALHAASRYGCQVTTTTISERQFELAKRRVREAGLEDRVKILLQDYRELTGTYDRLVSIEMIEAVGDAFHDEFFRVCSERLADDGAMLLQAITIQDQVYQRALKSVDFIQRYIFPGSCIPSIEKLALATRRATDLRFFHLEDIGPHYARTLRLWREAMLRNRDRVLALGLDEDFLRLFEFYFAYCEGGFEERVLGDIQLLLIKPRCRLPSIVPALPGSGLEGPACSASRDRLAS